MLKKDINEIKAIIEEYNIKNNSWISKNMNNTIGPQGEKVLDFVEKLKKKNRCGYCFRRRKANYSSR